jgi:hypothetical protein
MPVAPLSRGDKEARLDAQVREILGRRLKALPPPDKSEIRRFKVWARAFGYRALPASGAVVACYLMSIMNDTASLPKVRRAAKAITLAHAAGGRHLDASYIEATLTWAKQWRAAGEFLLQKECAHDLQAIPVAATN